MAKSQYKTLVQVGIGEDKDFPKMVSLSENIKSGNISIDLRHFWYPDGPGTSMSATTKGISFTIDQVPEMVEAVLELYRRATGVNLIVIDSKDLTSEEVYTLLGETSMERIDQALSSLDELLGQ